MNLFGLCVALLLISSQAFAGNSVGNGGTELAATFVRLAQTTIEKLNTVKLEKDLEKALRKLERYVKITVVKADAILFLDGHEVDAINYPDEKRILLSQKGFDLIELRPIAGRLIVVLHEYLGVARIDDSKYQVSTRLIAQIASQLQEDSVSVVHLQGLLGTFMGSVYMLLADVNEMKETNNLNPHYFCLDVGSINTYTSVILPLVLGNLSWFLAQKEKARVTMKNIEEIAQDLNQQCVDAKIDLIKAEGQIPQLDRSLKFLLQQLQFPGEI